MRRAWGGQLTKPASLAWVADVGCFRRFGAVLVKLNFSVINIIIEVKIPFYINMLTGI